jgi:hypothetical protein
MTHDATGENPITRILTDISNDEDGMVTLLGPDEDGKMHELPDSDHDGWIEIRYDLSKRHHITIDPGYPDT